MARQDTKRNPPTNSRTPGASQSRYAHQSQRQFWSSDRAQTSIDLLLAVTIFFAAVALVSIQAPGLFFPDGLSATDETTTADQIGLELTNTHLTEPGNHGGELSHDAVVAFLEDDTDLRDVFNVPDDRDIQITLSTPDVNDPPKALDPDADDAYDYTVETDGEQNFVTRGNQPSGPTTEYRVAASLNSRTVIVQVAVGVAQ